MQKVSVVHSDPEILGGTPVFIGTRVPLKNLMDYVNAGDSIEEFLDDFPSVSREIVIQAMMEMHQELQLHETELRGIWATDSNKVVTDVVSERINWLINSRLIHLGDDPSGWDRLNRDPASGRLWECLYPHNEWHGGGPLMLRSITEANARVKYGDVLEPIVS